MDSQDNGHLRGYALVDVETGREREFFSSLYDIPEVGDVHFVADGYEYLVEVKGNGPDDLTSLLANRIRKLPGVSRMATYIEGRYLNTA